jgi:molybdopterin-guanine dinucleotide biosynthesis protein A
MSDEWRVSGLGLRLPVHGFVLVGGKSLRMGVDKALLPLAGRPMVEIAAAKLREFCADVSVAGNREDLAGYAPVVHEDRVDVGPVAGIEAGLKAATREWVMFVPVDVPLVPGKLLRRWAEAVMAKGCTASYLLVEERKQPTFCLVRRECAVMVSAAIERGERRMAALLGELKGLWVCDAAEFGAVERWFLNLNTPQELAEAAAWVVE